MLFIASLLIKFMHVTHPTRFFIFSFLLKRVMTRGKCQDQNVYRYFFFFYSHDRSNNHFSFLNTIHFWRSSLCLLPLRIFVAYPLSVVTAKLNFLLYLFCNFNSRRKHILNGKSSSWHEWILKKISCNILYCEFVTRKFLKFQYRIFEFFK